MGDGLPRPVEVGLALLGLVLSLPVLTVAAAAIALTSRGPVLFSQPRVGRYGRRFTLYKLRSMRRHPGGAQVTAGGDDRVTAVGRVLRRTKLDELPELWNVVRGDLALVGPRPEVPAFVDLADERWQRVLAVRPGLTDPVTLRLRNEEALLAAVAGDRAAFYADTLLPYKLAGYLAYLERRTPGSDLAVLAQTVLAVLLPRRAPPPTLAEIRGAGGRGR